MNGRVIPVSGIELQVAARDDERLDADHQRQAGRQEGPEVVRGGRRDAQAALDDDEVEAEDRQHPDQAELLAEGGEREVGVDRGNGELATDLGEPRPQAGPEDAAAGEGMQRLDRLVARARAGPPRGPARCRPGSGRADRGRRARPRRERRGRGPGRRPRAGPWRRRGARGRWRRRGAPRRGRAGRRRSRGPARAWPGSAAGTGRRDRRSGRGRGSGRPRGAAGSRQGRPRRRRRGSP